MAEARDDLKKPVPFCIRLRNLMSYVQCELTEIKKLYNHSGTSCNFASSTDFPSSEALEQEVKRLTRDIQQKLVEVEDLIVTRDHWLQSTWKEVETFQTKLLSMEQQFQEYGFTPLSRKQKSLESSDKSAANVRDTWTQTPPMPNDAACQIDVYSTPVTCAGMAGRFLGRTPVLRQSCLRMPKGRLCLEEHLLDRQRIVPSRPSSLLQQTHSLARESTLYMTQTLMDTCSLFRVPLVNTENMPQSFGKVPSHPIFEDEPTVNQYRFCNREDPLRSIENIREKISSQKEITGSTPESPKLSQIPVRSTKVPAKRNTPEDPMPTIMSLAKTVAKSERNTPEEPVLHAIHVPVATARKTTPEDPMPTLTSLAKTVAKSERNTPEEPVLHATHVPVIPVGYRST